MERMEIKEKKDMTRWLRDLLCGALIGAGVILPGVSGGVLAVVFGIYQPFMEVLTHPLRALPKYWMWILPLALGWCAGFLGLARGITVLLHLSATVTVWLFIGLIVGTLPSLFREAGKHGRTAGSWASFLLCAAAMFFGLLAASRAMGFHVEPNFWWYNFCGVLWGMSVVIPGLTSSSIMMALDLYQPLMDGLAELRVGVLISTMPGFLLSIALLAHLMSWLFRRHSSLAYHGILGIVVASTLVIIPTVYGSAAEVVLSAVCCIGGFLIAFFMGRLDRKIHSPL